MCVFVLTGFTNGKECGKMVVQFSKVVRTVRGEINCPFYKTAPDGTGVVS